MIALKIDVIQDGEVALTVRTQRQAMRASHHAAAEHWRDQFLDDHFAAGAAARYGYKLRSQKYLKQKRRLAERGQVEHSGRRDLVKFGRLREMMVGPLHRITATPGRATVHMVGPNYLRINYKPGRPHLANEITTTIPGEREVLSREAGDAFAETVEQIRKRKTSRYQ